MLIFFSFSVLYYKKLDYIIYEKYLPEVRIRPRYSIATGEVTNKDKVTLWKDSDFVPWYGIVSYKISRFIKIFSGVFYLFAFLLYIPTLVLNILFYNRKAMIYCIILAFELAISFYLLGLFPPP
jgi:hypothetical protein